MKKIECIIPNRKFQDLEKVLLGWGIHGMTVTDVRGFGNEQTRPAAFLYLPKVKVELFCRDQDVDDIVGLIAKGCRTGQLGDGKIAIYDLDNVIRIRTGEAGEIAV